MKKGKTRERRQARTREAIIQAAEEIIESQGPDALNMRDLAERTDYSASNLYEYFSSKDELLAAVVKEAQARLVTHVHKPQPNTPNTERLRSVLGVFGGVVRSHPQLYLVIFGRKGTRKNTERDEISSPYDLLQEIIEEGIAAGIFLPAPDFGLHEMTFGCWSLVHGMATLRLTMQGMPWSVDFTRDDQILDRFVAGLRMH